MSRRTGRSHTARNLAVAVLAVPCASAGIVLSMAFMSGGTPPTPDCGTSLSLTQTAVSVDPATVPAGPISGYSHQQLVNAAQIMLAAQKLGGTVRDQTIGVMTAMGESSLTELDHGDLAGPDSRGLFQQRGNGAWGSLSDRMNPFTSATNYFRVEMKVAGRDTLPPTLVAHLTQGNADPNYYTPFWGPAQTVVQALSGIHQASTNPTTPATSAVPSLNGNQEALSTSTNYATAGMRPQTVQVANALGAMFHLKTIGGYRPMSSPYDDPKYGHSTGLAIDFMINDIPNGETTGYALAKYAQEHASQLGVQYIIYRQHIWAPYRADEGWRLMPDRGDPTQNHMDHVHVSLNGTGGSPTGTTTSLDGTTTYLGTTPSTSCASTSPNVDSISTQIAPVAQSGWALPAAGPITGPFGMRTNPVTGVYNLHSGVDIGAQCYAPIYAANSGTITQAGAARGYGNLITLDHGNGLVTRYAHMFDNGLLVHAGDHVKAGQQIAKVGTVGNSTGCHLHFEVMQSGQFVDPAVFMPKVGVKFG